MAAADAAMKLTPQEKSLYQRHLTNLTGSGGVDNPDGSRSTLFQASIEHDGKTYNIPTVWNGRILPIDQAITHVEKEGWDKFPAYANEQEAEARYQEMHKYMERDTGAFLRSRTASATPAPPTPAQAPAPRQLNAREAALVQAVERQRTNQPSLTGIAQQLPAIAQQWQPYEGPTPEELEQAVRDYAVWKATEPERMREVAKRRGTPHYGRQ